MRLTAVLVAASCLGVSPVALAQDVVRLASQGNEIGTESHMERWGTNGAPRARSLSLGEWATVSALGMLVSPRLLSWQLTLRPYAGQQNGSATTSQSSTRNLGLAFGANLLSGFPVSATLYSQRQQGRMAATTGGLSEFQYSSIGTQLQWLFAPLPLTLQLARRGTVDAWQSDPESVPLRRDERMSSGRLEARSSKMSISVERLSFLDRLGALDFNSTVAFADHTLRWGRGSSLATQLQSDRRTGSFAYDRDGAGVRLHVRHSPRATSEAFANRHLGTTAGLRVRQEGIGYEWRHRTRPWLTTSTAASRSRSLNGRAHVATSGASGRAEFARALPKGFRLTATSAVLLERVDRAFGDASWTFVFAESHRFDAGRAFDLPNVGVEAASVEVRSTDQTIVYLRGTDYVLLETGGMVRVQAIPGGRLAQVDAVVVDYRYAALDSGRHEILGATNELFVGTEGASIWWTEGHRMARHGDDTDDGTLEGSDRVVGVSIQRDLGWGRFALDATRRTRTRSAADVDATELHLGWTPIMTATTRASIGGRHVTSASRGQRLVSQSANASFAWNASASLQFVGSAERWIWHRAGLPDESFLSGTGEVMWRFGQVDVAGRYILQRRTLRFHSDQHRFTLRLVRHF